jgi:hypothetical protein
MHYALCGLNAVTSQNKTINTSSHDGSDCPLLLITYSPSFIPIILIKYFSCVYYKHFFNVVTLLFRSKSSSLLPMLSDKNTILVVL